MLMRRLTLPRNDPSTSGVHKLVYSFTGPSFYCAARCPITSTSCRIAATLDGHPASGEVQVFVIAISPTPDGAQS
jgi:hypothetical protein